jgi:hypothetical protein
VQTGAVFQLNPERFWIVLFKHNMVKLLRNTDPKEEGKNNEKDVFGGSCADGYMRRNGICGEHGG